MVWVTDSSSSAAPTRRSTCSSVALMACASPGRSCEFLDQVDDAASRCVVEALSVVERVGQLGELVGTFAQPLCDLVDVVDGDVVEGPLGDRDENGELFDARQRIGRCLLEDLADTSPPVELFPALVFEAGPVPGEALEFLELRVRQAQTAAE